MTAIESLSQAQSIVVMMDLGSAILSAETAVESLFFASLEKVIEEASNSLYQRKFSWVKILFSLK